ncbi:TPR-like protein [Punctularia strigosozonata HHB-11173 SS5]|uniref:TPR-like protein n=1 Tax=Punctularia strigosozonata (strain HHB-11173) TaxID=741275 RepID=R7S086_PUNST|nr:TPR-like protein [Punctularia strigosozonata HHB-11173 SS5]EIN03780.1 TPR-like protein [Punctularia strigosozonata HHB-11173 SS5]
MASPPQPAVNPSEEPEVANYQKRLDRALANGETVLSIFEALTEGVFICEPLKGSVKVARELIKMVQKVRKNREDCEELAGRVFKLTGTMLGILDGKRDEDVPADLKKCLDSVHDTLTKIKKGLEPLKLSRRFSLRAWFRALRRREYIADTISGYNTKIDRCLQEFTAVVTSQVRLGLMTLNAAVGVMYSRLDDVCSKATDIGLGVKKVHSDVKDIRSVLTEIYTEVIRIDSVVQKHLAPLVEGTSSGAKAGVSADESLQFVPAPPRLYGRDVIVKDVVGRVCAAEQHHIAILGTGGIGKTSVALRVIDDSAVKGQNDCYFIPCDTVVTDASLVATVIRAVDRSSSVNGDPMEHLKTKLRAASRPVVLVLDNFESPWDSDTPNIRQKLTNILRTLAGISNVQLIVTMRGDAPPADMDVQWSSMRLDPLGHIPAREFFLSMKPDTPQNEYRDLDLLLQKCDGLPLAIKLLAQLKPSSTCSHLLQRWEKRKTTLLQTDHISPSRETSLRVSISMSLQSAPMRLVKEAIPLLAVICRLPDGVLGGAEQLEKMDLGFDDVDVALATVLGSGLAFKAEDQGIKVLAPIREHVNKHDVATSPQPLLPPCQREALLRYYVQLVEKHAGKKLGDADFQSAYKTLLPETGNIISLFNWELDRLIDTMPGVAQAAFLFTRFQRHLRPSTELISQLLDNWDLYAIGIARAEGLTARGELLYRTDYYQLAMEDLENACEECSRSDNRQQLADALRRMGDIQMMWNAYPQAIEKLTRAHDVYSEIGHRTGVAGSLESLGDVHRMQDEYPQAIEKLTRAHDVYSEIGHRTGVAGCLKSLGDVHRMQDEYPQAIEKLTRAHDVYSEIGDRLGVANCLSSLGDIHYMQDEYPQAIEKLTRAHDVSSEIGDRLGVAGCLKSLCNIHCMQAEYPQAIEKLTRALDVYSEIGSRLGVAGCLKSLGNIHHMQAEYPQAIEKLTRAHDVYFEIGDRQGVAGCLESLGDVHRMQNEYPQAIEKLTRAHDVYSEIGHRTGVAGCLKSLGDVHRMQNEYPQAIEKLTRAHDVYSEIGDRLGVAGCLKSLGNIHRMQGEYPQAIEKLTRAHDVYSEIGSRLGVANCLESLGDVHRMQHEYPQAIEKLTRAHDVYSEIGDRLGVTGSLQSLADIDRVQERYDQAAEKLGRALDHASSIGDRYRIAWCHIHMGLLDRDQRRYAEAVEHITTARAMLTEIGHEGQADDCSRLLRKIHELMISQDEGGEGSALASDARDATTN